MELSEPLHPSPKGPSRSEVDEENPKDESSGTSASLGRNMLPSRRTRVLLFLGVAIGILLLYLHFLIESMDVIFEMKEVHVGFDNGAIQANFTASSQFLPGE
jgi:hypothetical protein